MEALLARCPDVPLVIETPPATDPDLGELLAGCHTVPSPATPEQIVAAVQEVLGERGEEASSGA